MSGDDFASVKKVLLERGEPKELFRFNGVTFSLDRLTTVYMGDLVFTENAICLVYYTEYRNLWKLFAHNPVMGVGMYLPAAFIFAIIGGALLFLFEGSEEAFTIGSIVGAIVSLFVTTLIIKKINEKYSYEKAISIIDTKLDSRTQKSLLDDDIFIFWWRDSIKNFIYDPITSTLNLMDEKGNVATEVHIPPTEWEKHGSNVVIM